MRQEKNAPPILDLSTNVQAHVIGWHDKSLLHTFTVPNPLAPTRHRRVILSGTATMSLCAITTIVAAARSKVLRPSQRLPNRRGSRGNRGGFHTLHPSRPVVVVTANAASSADATSTVNPNTQNLRSNILNPYHRILNPGPLTLYP